MYDVNVRSGAQLALEPSSEKVIDYVRQAMEHLYDSAYLETHALARFAHEVREGESRGRAVRRLLFDAVDALKPPPDVPVNSLSWRKHQYLYLRYVEALPVAEVAFGLGISVRQSRRYCQEGLAAIARIILDAQSPAQLPDSDTSPASAPRASQTPTGLGSASRDPVPGFGVDEARTDRGEAAPTGGISIGELLAGVVDTVRPLAQRYGVIISRREPDPPLVTTADRTTIRQTLLCLLEVVLNLGGAGVELSAARSGASGEILVLIRARLTDSVTSLDRRIATDEHWITACSLLSDALMRLDLDCTGDDEVTFALALPPIQTTTILVIEDSVDAVQLYRRFVSGRPYRLVTAAAARALSEAARERPAVIVLDVMMPNQDGWEVLQALKHHPGTRSIPVIVCSVLREQDLALALGAVEFLVKPVSRQVFLQTLDRLARVRPSARLDSHGGTP